ncbi:MAG: hypothetical protein IT210_03200 [Armatimonadetes bacterium]|nr:hypothetical protein [Armatimonadota bacterium]
MERLPENGAYTDNGVTLDLSRKDGQIWSYQARYVAVPPKAGRRPSLHADAIKALISQKSGSSQVEINHAILTVDRAGELIWFVKSKIVDEQGRTRPFNRILHDSKGEVMDSPR